jgi:hypothetical protein
MPAFERASLGLAASRHVCGAQPKFQTRAYSIIGFVPNRAERTAHLSEARAFVEATMLPVRPHCNEAIAPLEERGRRRYSWFLVYDPVLRPSLCIPAASSYPAGAARSRQSLARLYRSALLYHLIDLSDVSSAPFLSASPSRYPTPFLALPRSFPSRPRPLSFVLIGWSCCHRADDALCR